MPIAIVTGSDVSRATPGQQNSPKADNPKPLADKVGDPKPVKQLAPKVTDKPEIAAHTVAAQPPEPEPEHKPKPKPEPKPAKIEKPKQPAFKPDQIAEELNNDQLKKPPTPEEKPKPQKEVRPSPKFNADQVAALLDKRDPQRQTATAATLNGAVSLGAPEGHGAQLSQSEIDALRARISQCWNPPAGVDVNSKVYVVLHVLFKSDGSLAGEPVVVEDTASALGPALAESGKRALLMCQPFTMLRPDHYDQWKDIELKFDPHELLGG
jgi:outer membrane biosynthesis protein TonB